MNGGRSVPATSGAAWTPGGGPGAVLTSTERQQALVTFRKFGFLQIDHAFAPAQLTRWRDDFIGQYAASLADRRDTVRVGDRRFMTSVDLSGSFFDPALYANATLLPVISDLLGGAVTLASVCCVTALEGAAAQDQHADHPPLFPETALSSLLPAYAVTLIVPLVPLPAGAGATAVWPGSHLESGAARLERAEDAAWVPATTLGSAYLMDYRLVHQGMPNRTGALRPVLSIVYARPWFVDSVNFVTLPPLRLSPATRAAVPAEWAFLFAHASRDGV